MVVWKHLKKSRYDDERDELVTYHVRNGLLRAIGTPKFALKPFAILAQVVKESRKSGQRAGLDFKGACNALNLHEVSSGLVNKAISPRIKPFTIADEPGNLERPATDYTMTADGCVLRCHCRQLTSEAFEALGSYASRPRSAADTLEKTVEDLLAAFTS